MTDVATDSAPARLVWASDSQNIINELPNVAFSGDHYHRPAFVEDSYAENTGKVMSIDSSGRGVDENADKSLAPRGTMSIINQDDSPT